jgi:tRNA threonylcarbamoyladenosine biosynthesis protein TsaB
MADPRLILAIETSQREATVALRDRRGAGGTGRGGEGRPEGVGEGVIHEESLSPRKRHDDDLLPAIDRLFTRAGLRSADLRDGAVAVSIGPGGFTGLRIAIANAKMLSEALHVQLLAVPSALVAAEAFAGDGPIIVALGCKNETFWLTKLERAGELSAAGGESVRRKPADHNAKNAWQIVGVPGLARADAFDFSDVRCVLADEHLPETARARLAVAKTPTEPLRLSARACLLAGERMLARGEAVDPLQLLPLYPREPEAVSLWEARRNTPG